MPVRNYIPTKLADRSTWMANFATYVAANYLALALTSSDNDVIQAKLGAFDTAYATASVAETRSPVTIAAMVAADNDSLQTARFYSQLINNNPSTTDDQRAALQITIRQGVPRGRISAPTSWPVLFIAAIQPLNHKLGWRDSEAPTIKVRSKPYGALGIQLFQYTGATPPADPSLAKFVGNYTRLPVDVAQDAGSIGQTAYYYARWVTARGLEGPLVGPVSATIAN